jgi:predicted O-methyltransferase YrrM
MRFEEVSEHLDGIPYTGPQRGKVLYDFILNNKPAQCLELGFAHGVTSCYIAAALDEVGSGQLTSVDLESKQWDPSIEDLLTRTGLQKYVTVVRERNSYTWYLERMIDLNTQSNQCQPIYDFAFVDGAKNWTIDGLAFFLIDKLLKEGGWILFDDLKWTYSDKVKSGVDVTDGITIRAMGDDEIAIPHIELVFRLLVMQHPSYSKFRIQDDKWAWAQKISGNQKSLVIDETYSFKALVMRVSKKLSRIIG